MSKSQNFKTKMAGIMTSQSDTTNADPAQNLEPPTEKSISDQNQVIRLALNLIDVSPFQPRLSMNPIELDELTNSMRELGSVDEPIRVRQIKTGRYEMIAGHRRLNAAKNLSWSTIDAIVLIKNDREAELSTMINNSGRVDLSDFERAKLFKRAINQNFAKTQSDLAKLFATSQPAVSGCLAILDLPEPFIYLFEKHHNVLTRSTGKDIVELLKAFPEKESIVRAGVERVIQGLTKPSDLSRWVSQKVSTERGDKEISKYVVSNVAGKEVFRMKPDQSKKMLTISIATDKVGAVELAKFIVEKLTEKYSTE